MKISMTVPVIEEVTGDKKKMAFVVPGNLGENIPKPNNSHLSVKKFDQGIFATITYSGFTNNTKEEKMKRAFSPYYQIRHSSTDFFLSSVL